jgi:hypothetical protein
MCRDTKEEPVAGNGDEKAEVFLSHGEKKERGLDRPYQVMHRRGRRS